MKITGTAKRAEHLVDRIEARAAVGKLDIGEHQAGLVLADRFHRLAMRAGDAGDAMAKALDNAFEIHGDHRLVLDDEHVGRDLRGDLAAGEVDQLVDFGHVHIEDLRGLGGRETFHGAKQKGLAREAA